MIPGARLSPQALNILDLIPTPNLPGTRERDARQLTGLGQRDVRRRSDGRSDRPPAERQTNIFGRYSYGKFYRDGPTAFGKGGGADIVSLGGVSDVKNQSLALGVDRTFSSTLLADFRFGWFRYNVNVLPFDYGTTPATDAGIPGLNVDNTFTSGLPALFIGGDNAGGRCLRGRIRSRREPLQLPAGPEREAVADRRQPHQDLGQPQPQVRRRRAACLQPARAVGQPPLG